MAISDSAGQQERKVSENEHCGKRQEIKDMQQENNNNNKEVVDDVDDEDVELTLPQAQLPPSLSMELAVTYNRCVICNKELLTPGLSQCNQCTQRRKRKRQNEGRVQVIDYFAREFSSSGKGTLCGNQRQKLSEMLKDSTTKQVMPIKFKRKLGERANLQGQDRGDGTGSMVQVDPVFKYFGQGSEDEGVNEVKTSSRSGGGDLNLLDCSHVPMYELMDSIDWACGHLIQHCLSVGGDGGGGGGRIPDRGVYAYHRFEGYLLALVAQVAIEAVEEKISNRQ